MQRSVLRVMLTTFTRILSFTRFLFPSRRFKLERPLLWTTSNRDRIPLLLDSLLPMQTRRKRSSMVPFDWWATRPHLVSLTTLLPTVDWMEMYLNVLSNTMHMKSSHHHTRLIIWILRSTTIVKNGSTLWLSRHTTDRLAHSLVSLC